MPDCAPLDTLYYYIPTSPVIRPILGHCSASASCRRMAVAEVCQFVPCVEAVARHQVGGIAEGTTRKRALRMGRIYAGLRRFNPAAKRPFKRPFKRPLGAYNGAYNGA